MILKKIKNIKRYEFELDGLLNMLEIKGKAQYVQIDRSNNLLIIEAEEDEQV